MRSEYDFTGGVRGKHAATLREGYTVRIHRPDGSMVEKHVEKGVVTLAPDVQEFFPNSQAVNDALRSLIALIPERPKRSGKKAAGKKPRAAREKQRAKGRTRSMR